MKIAASVTRSAANDLIIFKSFFFVFCQIILFYSLDRWQIGIGAGNFIAFNTAFGAMLIGVMNLAGVVGDILAQISYTNARSLSSSPGPKWPAEMQIPANWRD